MNNYYIEDIDAFREKVGEDNIKKWCDALRSGDYEQTKGELYNENKDSYCCLGVAAKVLDESIKLDYGLPLVKYHPISARIRIFILVV